MLSATRESLRAAMKTQHSQRKILKKFKLRYIHIHIVDSLYCIVKTNTILQSNYIPIKKKQPKLSSRIRLLQNRSLLGQGPASP